MVTRGRADYCGQVSNTDAAPAEVACAASSFAGVLHPREVPLGGPRAIRVRRTLPQRERSLIGAWCFADHYGPHDVRGGTGMDVPPHPHTGLQTVSWLFSGEVEHRDSAGVHAMVRPGELNLMTAGAGSATPRCPPPRRRCCTARSCGWRCPIPPATPAATSRTTRPQPVSVRRRRPAGVPRRARGSRSPVHTFTPLLGAQLDLDPGARSGPRHRPDLRARRAARPGSPSKSRARARRRRPGVPGHRSRPT